MSRTDTGALDPNVIGGGITKLDGGVRSGKGLG
jgi:hypothetical protein